MKKLLLLFVVPFLVRAEPVSLSRTEAYELHSALTALTAGLTPDNTFAAADDINALDAAAKAFRQSYAKLLQLQEVANVAKTPEATNAFREADTRFAVVADERKPFDLKPVDFSKDEIKAANISATTLAVIKRLLKPDTKK